MNVMPESSLSPDRISCQECGGTYPVRHGIPVMYPPAGK